MTVTAVEEYEMEWVWVWACLFTSTAWAWARLLVGQMGTTVTQIPSAPPSTMQLDVDDVEVPSEEVVVEGEEVGLGALVMTVRMVVNSVAVGTMMVEKMVAVEISSLWSFLTWALASRVGRLLWMREGDKCVEAVEDVEVLGDSVYSPVVSLPWLPLWGRARARDARRAGRSALLAKVRVRKACIMAVWLSGDWGSVSGVKSQSWGGSKAWPYARRCLG